MTNPDQGDRLSVWPRSESCSGRQGRDHRGRHRRSRRAHRRRRPVLDVQEPDEYDQGALAGAVHIPRGHLESQVENKLTDKSAPVVVYCAGGTARRSPPARCRSSATRTSSLMDGGFGRWKDEGRPWTQPVVLTPDQRNRYMRHLLLPEVGTEGQRLLGAKVLLLGAGGLGSPAALSTPRRRRHARHRRHGRGRRLEPAAPDPPQPRSHRRPQGGLGEEDADVDQPRRRRRHLRHGCRPRTSSRSSPATT